MKKMHLIMIVIGLTISLTGCKDNNDSIASLTGSWRLNKTEGGMIANPSPVSPTTRILKFTASTYEVYANGSLVKNGNYTLMPETQTVNTKQANFKLTYDGDKQYSYPVKITGNTLIIFYGIIAADGVEEMYEQF